MSEEKYKLALEKAMALCSRSEKCKRDIEEKLKNWQLTGEKENRKIIGELVRNSFIDEKRYASSYTRDKYRFNKWGRIKIKSMLRSRGISGADIDYALGMIDHDAYLNMIYGEMDNKRKSVKAKNMIDLKGKLLRFGLARGYESEYIYDYIDRLGS